MSGESMEIGQSCKLRFIAIKSGFMDSDVVENEFIIYESGGEGVKQNIGEYIVRPNILADDDDKGSSVGMIDMLDTPFS